MNNIKQYVSDNMDHFRLLSISTNKVLEFSYAGKPYIIKKQSVPDDRLSPFWQMMKDIFGFSFKKQRANIKKICSLLQENPHIRVANLVLVDEKERMLIFDKMPGNCWEPDEFPEGSGIAYQLGQFIGFNHSRDYEKYQLPGVNDVSHLKDRIIHHIKDIISLHWDGKDSLDSSVRAYAKRLDATDFLRCDLSLIMTDISANQFIFDKDEITACVDLDAYVIGPKEWELALLQNCVKDRESFIRGYEQYQNFPNIENANSFCFLMALNDVWEKEEMRGFFQKRNLVIG